MSESTPEPFIDPDESALDHDDDFNLDPGASPQDAGVPGIADESTPGSGEVPEPERTAMPTEAPVASTSYGVTQREQAEETPLDQRLEAEEPDLGSEDWRPPEDDSTMHVEEEPTPLEHESPRPRPPLP